MQPVQSPEATRAANPSARQGDDIDPAEFLRWLASNGFQNTTAVELPGEFAARGGIIDIFAPDWFEPVRIELFGDKIESIRRFEVATQRSLGDARSDRHDGFAPRRGRRDHFAAYLPPESWFLLVEPHEVEEEGRHYLERLERPQDVHDLDDAAGQVYQFPSVTASAVASGSLEANCQLRIETVERFSGDIGKVRDELDTIGLGHEVFIVCQTEAEVERLREVLGNTRLAQTGRLHFPIGRLQAGFRLVPERIVLVQRQRAVPPRRSESRPRAAGWAGRSTASSSCAKAIWSSTCRTASAAIAA